jgi:hypothetical protein
LNIDGSPAAYCLGWHIRKKVTQTWVKIGEPLNRIMNFDVRLDTEEFEEGAYQILGFLRVRIRTQEKEAVRVYRSLKSRIESGYRKNVSDKVH